MRCIRNKLVCLFAATLALLLLSAPTPAGTSAAGASSAHPPAQTGVPNPPPPKPTAKVKRLLKAMSEASTWAHPDLFGQFAGIRHLYAGEYQAAMKSFKIGARYGDKLSQASIGFIYQKGRGVPRNLPLACAWLTMAAERGYPRIVEARDHVCNKLSADDMRKSRQALAELMPVYADKVAKPRMRLALADARRGLTGSHTGFNFGVSTSGRNDEEVMNCDESTALEIGAVAVPKRGCGTYNSRLWNAKTYFAARDAQWFSSVTIGKLESGKNVHPKSGSKPGTNTPGTVPPDQTAPPVSNDN